MKGFLRFIREQGVVGLAVGFILGGAVSALVASIVKNILDPLIGLLLGRVSLSNKVLHLGHTDAIIAWGAVLTTLINFIAVAAVVYFGVKWLRLDKLDSEKAKAVKKAEDDE